MADVSPKSDARRIAARSAAILRHEKIHARCALALGVSRSEITTLMLVSAGAPVTPSTVSEALSLTTGTITSLIDRLGTRQLLHREPHPGDRRSILLTVTPPAATLPIGSCTPSMRTNWPDAASWRPQAGH